MPDSEAKLREDRRRMVESQLRARDIRDPRVLEAFLEVPREYFVPALSRVEAYCDAPLPIGHRQTISQPYITALSVEALQVDESHRVLDVGAGSGYQTAILARLARYVYAVERIHELTERAMATLAALNYANVTFRTGDGTLGWPEEAPFDRIVCGAASPDVPPAWIEQLADDGRIVLPVGGPDAQTLILVEKRGARLTRRNLCDVRFVRLIGQGGWPE